MDTIYTCMFIVDRRLILVGKDEILIEYLDLEIIHSHKVFDKMLNRNKRTHRR